MLGGLIITRSGKDKSGIPLLGDIPYLGRLFSTTIDTTNRSELMVFIQPSIVNSDRSLNDVQAEMDARYKVSEKARTFADGPGVLPPPDAITPYEEKGSSSSTTVSRKKSTPAPKAAPVPASSRGTSNIKPSIRPAHRR